MPKKVQTGDEKVLLCLNLLQLEIGEIEENEKVDYIP